MYRCKSFTILLVVKLLIKYFIIWQNKNYSSIYKSIIITSPIGFNIVLPDVEAALKKLWFKVVSTFCNVVTTLFQRQALTLHQIYATSKIWHWIFFSFSTSDQNYLNVDPQLWKNVPNRHKMPLRDFNQISFDRDISKISQGVFLWRL